MSAPAAQDRITCHVLDTTAGRPARGLRVRLELQAPAAAGTTTAASHHGQSAQPSRTFESQTDDDGRVRTWLPYSSSNASGEVPVYTLEDVLGTAEGEAGAAAEGSSTTTTTTTTWTLRFDTEGYFGGPDETFFPEAAVTFRVAPGQHYHVPLLLSPYSYTTYRGS
ncbi:uncharacterized protein E0L32_005361 [Thyridium curvatum]|uniref:hydroxyisourate hydrolase n=1 Tax=Thyridium curvatum TaxID=1093900 RepID=A0A507B3R8_9PEZI|nr:uncharacterized protein E0L32_005361 [Thyridium curvatum]TPX14397.1 hypothetical protein E0L32_005361 [Thyridium curvatum]